METSCLKNTNVADAFETLIEITNREAIIKNKNKSENFKITKSKNKKKSCSC